MRFFAPLSLLLPASCLFAFDTAVVFNEVNYHPTNELTQTEWVEIKSNQGVDIDISGWSITGGVNYTFPANTVLTGNGVLVIATVPAQISGSIGPMTGTLKNSGETIRIRNRNGRIMDELSYDDQGDWPLAADGLGFTLARKNSAIAATGASAWGASQQPGGTPGTANFTPPATPVTTVAQTSNGQWKYDNSGVAPTGDWTAGAFNDSAWPSAPAPFYFGSPNPTNDPSSNLGLWSIARWTGDADSLISAAKTYTHAVDFGHTGTNAVNGVSFECPGTSRTGPGTIPTWSVTNAAATYTANTSTNTTRNPMTVGTGSYELIHEFFYGSPETSIETLTLTGLTSGQTYTLTFYNTGWDLREARRMKVTPSNTNVATVIDSRPYGLGKCSLLQYTYKAPASGSLSITLEPLLAASWHMCAITNEVAPALSAYNPVSGVTAQAASSQQTGRSASFTADSSGLDAYGNHGATAASTMWLSNGTAAAPNDALPADITWSFPANTSLSALQIWNYNELSGTTEYMNRGVKDVEILVSPDASGETFASVGTYLVPQASGSTSEMGSRIVLGSTQNNVRRVRLNATTNWGDATSLAGLSEVQFLSPLSFLASNPTTTRFRKQFSVGTLNPNATYTLNLQYGADDAAVFYLNGTEIHRYNLPAAPAVLTPTTISSTVIGTPSLSSVFTLPGTALLAGTNTLAVQLHQSAVASSDAWFTASLSYTETALPTTSTLVLSEIAGSLDPAFFLELKNTSANPVSTSGWGLSTSLGQTITLPVVTVPAGGYATFTAAELGLSPVDGLRLALTAANGAVLRDARKITTSLRGLTASGLWGHPSAPSSGAANTFSVSNAIVINEIFYQGLGASAEQWVELYNRSASPVDLSGWKFSEGVSYTFLPGTVLPAGGYLVVAWDTAAFATLHPGVTALGPFSGSLSGAGETLSLSDANENIANSVRYGDGGLWSEWANGGGSSLELMDPDADNSKPGAWDASDESTKTPWQTVTYSAAATLNPANDPTTWNEFIFGMLDAGEVLIDDVSVKDVTQGGIELIQNGTFASNSNFWRIIGNHSGTIVPDPTNAANNVLKLSATSATDPMHNQATTTLKNGSTYHTIVTTDTYTVSFRAKWLRGSNRLHARLYPNRLPHQTELTLPLTGGTPGAVNSRRVTNIGPTFAGFGHSPAVPAASAPAVVTVNLADPDGVASVQLFTSVNGAAFTSAAMAATDGAYTGTIPGQAAGNIVQFYVRATDSLGAISYFPPGAASSRALIQWADGRNLTTLPSGAKPHNLRVIITGADATEMYKQENLMSNADVPCTIVWDESVVYYRAAAQLKSSEHGRLDINRVGYNLSFAADEPFLGVHGAVAIDRSGGTGAGQKEILLKTLSNLAGGVYAPEDDIIRLIPAKATGTGFTYDGTGMLGPAILSKTRLKGDFLDGQFNNGGQGMMFKYERIYVLTQTINPTTRVVDAAIVPENPKITQTTTSPPGVNVQSLGTDKEYYRWHWLVEGGRGADDFTGLINTLTAIGQTGGTAAFNTQTDQYLDISPWLRATIPAALFGVQDNYLGKANGQHNALFYFPPGGKALLLPWDLDYVDQSAPTAATLTAAGDLTKFIANPVYKRLYWGHMLDILNKSFNTTVMTKWATHYSRFSSDDMVASVSAYLTPRADYARTQITAAIPSIAFAISAPANNTTVNGSSTSVSGSGWIDVSEIRLAGSPEPLNVTWTGESTWTLTLPLAAGTVTYTINAYNRDGTVVGTTTRTITNTSSVVPAVAGMLTVTELNYNPASADDLSEFIELTNLTASTLDLSNCHFDEENAGGIAYTFPVGTTLAARARLVVVRDRTAYQAAYGNLNNVATGQWVAGSALSNSGETIILYAANGTVLFQFAYNDKPASTDGGGRTLVRNLAAANADPAVYLWLESTTDGGTPGTAETPTGVEDSYTATEDTPLVIAAPGVMANDISPEFGSTITATLLASPPAETGIVAFNANGSFTFTPAANYSGPTAFNYRVTDGTRVSSVTTVNLTVTAVNDTPVFAPATINLNATEDTAFTGQLAATDADVGDTLTYAKVSGPAWLTVSPSGALSGTPSNAEVGLNTFTVSVTDAANATASATLKITVANTNDAPVFASDPIALGATGGSPFTGQLSASDVDTGTVLTYAKVSGPSWLTVSSSGALGGTPSNAEAGLNAFTVSASDGTATVNAALNVTVAVSGPSFTSFTSVNFSPAEQADPLVSGPAADPDHDGIPNLLEYAFGSDPRQGSTSASAQPKPILVPVSAQDYVGMSYTRLKGAADLTIIPEFSTSPDNAGFAPGPFTVVLVTDNGNGTETVTVRENAAISSSTPRFIRLRVQQN